MSIPSLFSIRPLSTCSCSSHRTLNLEPWTWCLMLRSEVVSASQQTWHRFRYLPSVQPFYDSTSDLEDTTSDRMMIPDILGKDRQQFFFECICSIGRVLFRNNDHLPAPKKSSSIKKSFRREWCSKCPSNVDFLEYILAFCEVVGLRQIILPKIGASLTSSSVCQCISARFKRWRVL